jgi:O-antigen/teichoic acid export membrane protein
MLATGTSMAFLGSVVGNALVYLYGVMIGRLFGAEILGLFFLALVCMQIISAVCRLGLPEGLLRFVSIYSGQGDRSRVKGTILAAICVVVITSMLAASLFFLLADRLSIQLFNQPNLAVYLRWFAIALPLFSIFIIITNANQALKRMDLVVLARDFIQPLIMFVLSLVLFYFLWRSIESFLAGYLISVLLAGGASIYLLRRIYPALHMDTQQHGPTPIFEWKTLLSFSLPIAGCDIAYYLFRWIDTFLLSYFRSPLEVGIYNAALRTTLLLTLLAVSVNALYAPIIADHHHHDRRREMETILQIVLRWCLTLALPIVFAMGLLSEEILLLWGPEFLAGGDALILLALSQLIFIGSNVLAFTLLMCRSQYIEVGNTAFVTALNVILNLTLIPRHGITGAAIAMLASQSVGLLIRITAVQWVLGINIYTTKYVKPLVAMITVSLLMITFRKVLLETAYFIFLGFHLGALAALFLLTITAYLTILYFLGFEREDLLLLRDCRLSKAVSRFRMIET